MLFFLLSTPSDCGQDMGSYAWLFAYGHGIWTFQNLACSGLDAFTLSLF